MIARVGERRERNRGRRPSGERISYAGVPDESLERARFRGGGLDGRRDLPVRLQMLWDNPAVLERRLWLLWGWSLGDFRVMLQSSLFDGVAFDPFAFQQDGLASVEVDVGRCQVLS